MQEKADVTTETVDKAEATTKPVDRELVLHYIDKLHTGYVGAVQASSRIDILLLILSLLVLGLSLGLVSIDQSITFGGVTVGINSALILIGGSALIGILLMYDISLAAEINTARAKILELYRSTGMSEEVLWKTRYGFDRFGFTGGMTGVLSNDVLGTGCIGGIFGLLLLIILLGAAVFLPLVAQIAACWRMIVLFGWNWWVIGSFLLLFLSTTGYVFLYFKNILAPVMSTVPKAARKQGS